MIQKHIPEKLFDQLDSVTSQLSTKEPFVFLDYDGTLTPIVDTPDQAILSDETRSLVDELKRHYKVSIVSGRATDDVRSKVKIDQIFYAGSHGFEIVCPDGHVEINQEAAAIRSVIDEVFQKLNDLLCDVDGALVEHVKYTISVHYRLVSNQDFPKVKDAVEKILLDYPQLRKTDGKKVFELRGRIDWDKGKAVNWILDVLKFNPQDHIAIYIGDDTTDEDAFKVLGDQGFGILVADPVRESFAKYVIDNTDQLKDVLQMLINLKK